MVSKGLYRMRAHVGPRVSAAREAAISERVEHALVGVILGAEEHEVLQRVRAAIVVVRLSAESKVAVDDGSCIALSGAPRCARAIPCT